MIELDELKRLLEYNPDDGYFRWKVRRPGATTREVGDIAGGIVKDGYRQIRVYKKHYYSHRLAWFYVTGEWPKAEIDHINGIVDDNRLCNLREATSSQNKHNSKISLDNSSGYKGVNWDKKRRKWRAQIRINYKPIDLGFFDDPKLAHAAYCKAADEIHGKFKNYGEHVAT